MSGGLRHQLGDGGTLDTEVVTVGFLNQLGTKYYGYSAAGTFGSISDGAFAPKAGAAINQFFWADNNTLVLNIAGALPNDGWTQVVINGVTFTRASATFSSSGTTQWSWSTATNPFGTTTGAAITAVFS